MAKNLDSEIVDCGELGRRRRNTSNKRAAVFGPPADAGGGDLGEFICVYCWGQGAREAGAYSGLVLDASDEER